MDPFTIASRVGMVLAGLGAGVLVYSMGTRKGDPLQFLRQRLLFCLPLGTLLSGTLVWAFFMFVQGGWGSGAILTLPFTSWSLQYPLGMATAPIAHQNLGHLVGNLTSFLIFGSIAEYTFSHYPSGRGTTAFGSLRTNPYVRALLIVPLAVFGVALLTSLFAWGPIIGFSGVTYAAVGYVLVQYPVGAVVALAVTDFARTLVWTFRNPVLTRSAGSSYGGPWWADIAVQTHLLGLLLGVALGLAIRSARPWLRRDRPGRVFGASILVGGSLTLWALWWYVGPSSYQLFRGPGVILVVVVAALITVADGLRKSPVKDLSARQLSIGLIVFPVLLMGVIAIPVNATMSPNTVGTEGPTVTVEGYEIGYGESVADPRFEPINVSYLPTPDPPRASGVIVANGDRHLWTTAVSTGRLKDAGSRTVTVGGLGWREQVSIDRTGWRAAGGGSAFVVTATPPNGSQTALFESEGATANTVIDGHRLAIMPSNGDFAIKATAANNTSSPSLPATVQVPMPGETVTLGELTVKNEATVIWIEREDTRVPVFERENE